LTNTKKGGYMRKVKSKKKELKRIKIIKLLIWLFRLPYHVRRNPQRKEKTQ